MQCKKCENNLDNDSKFCTKCGEKVSIETSSEIKTNEKIFESQTVSEIKKHLEFFGYSCEFSTKNHKSVVLIATHTNKPNIICSSSVDGVVFLSSTWNGLKEVDNIEQYKCLNTLTLTNTFAQLAIDDDGDLSISSTYTGEYSKIRFGEFFDLFINDINRTLKDEAFKQLFCK